MPLADYSIGSASPWAASARHVQPREVARSEHLRSASLDATERADLVSRLYDVYCETVRGDTQDQLAARIFAGDEVRLIVYYGALGQVVGFAYAGLERMAATGDRHAIFYAGVFFRRGYHCGASAIFWGLRQALHFKLSEPRTRLAYCTRSSSPAPYRLLAATMPRVYPCRNHRTPPQVEALARAFSARMHYVPIGASPWIVHSGAIPRDAARLHSLEHDPHARFYRDLNPRFAEGEALLTWIPLDPANIAGGFVRLIRTWLKPMRGYPRRPTLARRPHPLLIALLAGAGYGSWAAFAHCRLGADVAVRAGLTQFALSTTATLLLAMALKGLFRRPSNPEYGFWLAFLGTWVLGTAWLAIGHALVGTPHAAVAIAPSVVVGATACFAYARTLLSHARRTDVQEPSTGPQGTCQGGTVTPATRIPETNCVPAPPSASSAPNRISP
ncbi:hypothetical protein DSM43518_03586 [Mycobacterium marinum]|nr:hypothetical protein DSM43518_03586 [Mycobacterium marinum]CDM77472.1 conserved hypothetical membrane protein [Mycobacterium marinum E11]RFZ21844.1 hypothetical protein VIMS_00277 [Mycobacterium marinum]RFZ30147.1 hypothetical protein NCTC2275_04022 [Mycobacterium marinum]RFZ32418.1 hypothetical protein KST_04489 [Mycobacterium marinum]